MKKNSRTKAVSEMKDGLYRVETPRFTAGFVIRGGKVAEVAPILRKRIGHWKTVAEFVAQ